MKQHWVIALSATMFALGACGGNDNAAGIVDSTGQPGPSASVAQTGADPTPSVTAGDAASLPQGTFERTVTSDEASAYGVDPAIVDEVIGADGGTTFSLKLEGDRFTQFQTDEGVTKLEDGGSLHLDQDGHMVMTSGSDNSIADTFVIDWSLDGDGLTTTCLSGCTADFNDGVDRLVYEGTWVAVP